VESFDVVFSSFVLEHVQRADVALKNFATWLKPGGLLILRLPERSTARAFLTRILRMECTFSSTGTFSVRKQRANRVMHRTPRTTIQ
jgi:2-polyprenyl-3-methyl-5-hydroxy-6-metoxy-1,4-benzoquinol methylase